MGETTRSDLEIHHALLFFFPLCCTAVLTKIRTCRETPFVSGTRERQQRRLSVVSGERGSWKRGRRHSQQGQHPQTPPAPLPALSLPLPQDSPPKPCGAQSVPLLARKQARARRSNSWIFRLVFSLPKEAEGELFYQLALVFTGEQESRREGSKNSRVPAAKLKWQRVEPGGEAEMYIKSRHQNLPNLALS